MTETSPDSDFMASVRTTIRDAVKLKTVMLKKRLDAARAPCPECGGEMHGRLAGPRKHMRFWCTGTCNRRMME